MVWIRIYIAIASAICIIAMQIFLAQCRFHDHGDNRRHEIADSYAEAYDNCWKMYVLLESKKALNYNNESGVMLNVCYGLYKCKGAEVEGRSYSKPMLWIGIYIAVASLFCILLMAADLFHGFRNRKLWFPSKYFTLNAASITIITIAMKLPVDLSTPMPANVDQFAKHDLHVYHDGQFNAFSCFYGNRELFANVAGMVILVVTMVVNILIEMKTGVVSYPAWYSSVFHVCINIAAMLSLLVLVISSALTIPTSKRILESKYQEVHKTTSNQHTRISTFEELTQHVRKYWMMAGTGSPQFVMITSPLSSAAGIICATTTIFHYFMLICILVENTAKYYLLGCKSDYKWSTLLIYITHTIGIGVGTVALVFRSFAALNFKLSVKWIKKHTKVYHVEKHWTQMLTEWRKIDLPFPLGGGHVSKAFVYVWYNLILNLCIICQKVIVVSCKILGLIPLAMVIVGVFCVHSWKSLKANFFAASNRERIPVVEQNDTKKDIENYALQLQDEVELSIRVLKSISNSVNRSIQKAEKQPPINLIKLIEQSTRFEGVVNFDRDNIQPLDDCAKFPNSWSLPVVTLACIAVTLPNTSQESIDCLFNGVREGLSYTLVVEESLNNLGEYVKIHKATTSLWREVDISYRWLGNALHQNAYRDKSPKEILEWFAEKAKDVIVEMSKHNNEELPDDSCERLIAADSMYRVTQTIMVNYPNDIERNREEQLFGLLSGMIVDIVVACFTNLPRVIQMKCHEDAIEKREASVQAAAKLLGSTKKIIEKLQSCEVPTLDPEERAFIDEWRVHLKQSIP
ncbi:LOW QUALITY PROTEIN: hypothetical protein OSB04_022055 [Centaurea solstitialis]|uniref:Uncharacterized protein n=1 Tax=Centaurea solstitialis TaxID=347529 RepID=A0AA38W7A5_9ASTR|nr:LOW QUALITY PROTEIN: hypothetical protein OSB04_022055 [Centaurea solstitialis]